jgi:hypothetical protein
VAACYISYLPSHTYHRLLISEMLVAHTAIMPSAYENVHRSNSLTILRVFVMSYFSLSFHISDNDSWTYIVRKPGTNSEEDETLKNTTPSTYMQQVPSKLQRHLQNVCLTEILLRLIAILSTRRYFKL